MLNLFRQNTFTAGVLIILLAGLFRVPYFIDPKPYPFLPSAFLSNIFFDFLKTLPNYFLLSYLLAMLLVIAQASMLNYTVSKHDILYKDTFLPGFAFVLLNSLYPEQAELTPQLISCTFLILVFQRLCYLYESPKPLLLVLDSGMYLGVGIMFNYELVLFLPFILISVVVFTSFNLRYIVISLLGIALPIYFVVVFYYITDNLAELVEIGKSSIYQIQLRPVIKSYENVTPWFFILPLVAFGAFNLQQNFFRNKVKTRRIIQSIAVFGFFGALAVISEINGMAFALSFISIPMSIVLGYYFISTKRFWLKEIMVYSIMILALYFQIK